MASSVTENEDLLRGILLRLLVKALIRFKCVSKHWLTLISNPRFCHSHTLRRCHTSPRPFPSLLLYPEPSNARLDFPIIPLTSSDADPSPLLVSNFRFLNAPNMELSIRQSCNGLLLVEERKFQGRYHPNDRDNYFVCNPITKQFVAISVPSIAPRKEIHSLFLAFDPMRSSQHFKLVSIRRRLSKTSIPDTEFEIDVYSSESGCWSDLGVFFTAPPFSLSTTWVYCNGAIHWYMRAENSLYFDVENQCLKNISNAIEY